MSSALPELFQPPPTRIRASVERRTHVPVEFEIPAGTDAYPYGNTIIINAGPLGYMIGADAAARGLIKMKEVKSS